MSTTGMMPNGKPGYPAERGRFFAMKFLRLLAKTCAAQEIGQDAFVLLTIIVTLEDVTRYRRGVTFYNEQLMPILGFTRWHRLDAARQSAIKAGWLHYDAPPIGKRGTPGVYWVTIPAHAEGLPDSAIDEGQPSTESVDARVDGQGKASTENVYGCVDGSVDARVDGCVELPILSLNPNPSPNVNTSSCPASADADEAMGKGKASESSNGEGKAATFSPEDLTLAQWIWQAILAMQPERKAPKLDRWANDIRLMRERDQRTHEQIRDLFGRVQRDPFWRVNVLSPDKLRAKFDDLTLRLKDSANGTGQPHPGRRSANRAGVGTKHDPQIPVTF